MVEPALEQVAKELAAAHRMADHHTIAVYWAPDPEGWEIRLVEVSGSVGDTGEVLPFRFGPQIARGVPYASVVILLNPDEWEKVKSGELKLPPNWPSADKLIDLEEQP